MKSTFTIDRSQDPGKHPVYMIGIDGGFMDYELTYEELVGLGEAIKTALQKEKLQVIKEPIIFHEKLSGEILRPDLENADPTSPFFNKKVVITGVFNTFSRDDLAQILKALGADLNGSISSKTDVVIAGSEAGPSKMQKVQSLIAYGASLVLLNENEFNLILKTYRESRL